MGEVLTVEDIRRSNWREPYEEQKAREFEKRRRELDAERERKARVAKEKQQQAATNNSEAWYAAIDERMKFWFDHYFDGLGKGSDYRGLYADEIAKALAGLRRQLHDELKRSVEEERRAFEAKLVEQREHFLASNNQAAWVSWVDDRIRATFGYGRDVLLAEVKDIVEGAQCSLETKLVALEERVKAGLPSKLPVAKTWCPESVAYQAEFVCHEGALWQACKDTAQTPGGSDWVCVARSGRDALTPKIRGAYDAHKNYAHLDIVEYDGSSYLARRDVPGVPGISDGWQPLCRAGRRGPAGVAGPRGAKGERGARGEDAPTIVSWTLDRVHYSATPTMSNGTQGAPLELRGLFERFVEETSHAAE